MSSTPFIHKDFLLTNKLSRFLYHEVARDLPIIDYHCHLPPADIAANRRFANLFEIWLEGDHYKWRAMRANGIDERLCTGDASPEEKFFAFAQTVPMALRNPLYHWTHLELKRYFGIGKLLGPATAEAVWERANELLAGPDLDVDGIFRKMKVEVVATTDDPADDLEHHRSIARRGCPARVLPAFRPDKVTQLSNPEEWNAYIGRLGQAAGRGISSIDDLLQALADRHRFFHENGCRLSDHGLERCPGLDCNEEQAAAVFSAVARGEVVPPDDEERFTAFILRFLAGLDARAGWVQQFHLGAQRNNNPRMFRTLGRDTGFDSIGDWRQAQPLARFLGGLEENQILPKTILYNLNPADNYVFATMIGNFNDGSVPGKIQFGSGWWFLDQKEGMEWQLNALSNLGLLSRFVGMLTDSRSFMSYPRHEYFRRILCEVLGSEARAGLIPEDRDLLADYVGRICYRNAREYFPFWDGQTDQSPA